MSNNIILKKNEVPKWAELDYNRYVMKGGFLEYERWLFEYHGIVVTNESDTKNVRSTLTYKNKPLF